MSPPDAVTTHRRRVRVSDTRGLKDNSKPYNLLGLLLLSGQRSEEITSSAAWRILKTVAENERYEA